MDGNRFDDLARTLAGEASSRRGLIRGLLGAALGGAMAVIRRGLADAETCGDFCNELPPGRPRGRCARACAQGDGLFFQCDGDPSRLCERAPGSFVCCAAGEACCDGRCVDPTTDRRHCGGCGHGCEACQDCEGAFCVARLCTVNPCIVCNPATDQCEPVSCPAGRRTCCSEFDPVSSELRAVCVDVDTNPDNCGGCGRECGAGEECVSGVCCRSVGSPCNADSSQCCGHFGPNQGGSCIDGICHCCPSASVTCGRYASYDTCCDWPQCSTLCCDQPDCGGGADDAECIPFCVDCDVNCHFNALQCPASHPFQVGGLACPAQDPLTCGG